MSHTGSDGASRKRSWPRALVFVAGCGAAGVLGAVAFAPQKAAHAARPARPTEVLVAGRSLRGNTSLRDESIRLANEYLHGSLRLRAAGRVLDARRAELGASIDLEHLQALLAQASDAASALRRLHGRALAGRPVALPLPARLDAQRTRERLLPLWDELYRAPSEAHVDPRTRSVVQAKPGRTLDVHGALDAIEGALRLGQREIELPMLELAPNPALAKLERVEMSALLGEFTTRYNQADTAKDRTHNLEMAAQRINGHVVAAGAVLDFNSVVGDRTQANGFKAAPVIADGQLTDGVGGGTCQVASTLHAAVFFAGLPILERHPHSRPSYYTKLGLDAAVAYGSLNFRFKNDLPFPVVLEATLSDGVLRAAVHGKERTRTVSFLRRIDATTPFAERSVDDENLPRGVRVLAQRGIPGFAVTRFRAISDLTTHASRRERLSDSYPPTEQLWRIGKGGDPGPEFVPPKNDSHPEYVADELFSATQGPSIDGTQIERTEGKSGAYGWTEREGMRIAAAP